MNKNIKTAIGTIFLTALLFTAGQPASAEAKAGKGSGTAAKLLGSWDCTGTNGVIPLVFKNANTLVFNGEAASYTLVPGAIRVRDEAAGHVNYKYKLSKNSLKVTLPDGSAMECKRASSQGSEGKKTASGVSERMIFGTFCSWSGSSTGSSSYSSSGRAAFDGKGSFSYGSESSFSSSQGMYYGSNPGAGNRGAYKVSGNSLILTFNDGTTARAEIHFRYPDGSVSEIMHGKTLYGKALCQ